MKTIFYNKEHNIRVKYAFQLDNKPLFIMCLPENKVAYCQHETIAQNVNSFFYMFASSMGNVEYIRLQKAMYKVIDIKLSKIMINEYATHIIKHNEYAQNEHTIIVTIDYHTVILNKTNFFDLSKFVNLKEIGYSFLKDLCLDIKKYVDKNIL